MASDVLLVNPNRTRPPVAPLAVEYLAHALDAASVSYSVLDLCFAEDPRQALADALNDAGPRLVAITFRNTDDCYCATQHSFIPHLHDLVADVRAVTDAPVVLGGSGFSVAPVGILRRTSSDFGVQGDGEGPLVQLARAVRDGDDAFASVPGLAWRVEETIHANAPAWQPLAQDPLPRNAVDGERYFREGGQAGIETKRGCPMRCVYCADGLSKGGIVRTRPPAAVAAEMIGLAARGVDVFHTCDSEFNCDPTHALALCEELIRHGAREKLRWYAYCSPTPFTGSLARRMSDAGCVGINFGADSGDPEMLQRLGRDHARADILAVARACRENGIAVMFDLLLGSPGETPASLARSIDLMRESRADCFGVALGVRIYPDTVLATSLREHTKTGDHAGLRGQVESNEDLAEPLFYLEPQLGDDPVALLKGSIAGDERFFFGWPDETQADYNYDDNPELVQAIRDGHRGAYWDILRKLRGL